jgi:hypothetical protein
MAPFGLSGVAVMVRQRRLGSREKKSLPKARQKLTTMSRTA